MYHEMSETGNHRRERLQSYLAVRLSAGPGEAAAIWLCALQYAKETRS